MESKCHESPPPAKVITSSSDAILDMLPAAGWATADLDSLFDEGPALYPDTYGAIPTAFRGVCTAVNVADLSGFRGVATICWGSSFSLSNLTASSSCSSVIFNLKMIRIIINKSNVYLILTFKLMVHKFALFNAK